MDHGTLVQVIRTVIAHREDSDMSQDPDDYDLDAIAAEAHRQTEAAGVDELDPEVYWRIVEDHTRA